MAQMFDVFSDILILVGIILVVENIFDDSLYLLGDMLRNLSPTSRQLTSCFTNFCIYLALDLWYVEPRGGFETKTAEPHLCGHASITIDGKFSMKSMSSSTPRNNAGMHRILVVSGSISSLTMYVASLATFDMGCPIPMHGANIT